MGGLLALGLVLAAPPAPAADTAARFEALWRADWAFRLADSPLLALQVGEPAAGLDAVDAAARERRLAHLVGTRDALAAIDRAELPAAQRVDAAILAAQLEDAVAELELGGWMLPLNGDSSFYADLAFMPRLWRIDDEAEARRYLATLAAIPRYFDQHLANLEAGIARGVTVPRVVLAGRERAAALEAGRADPATSPYFAPLENLPDAIPAATRQALREEGLRLIRDDVAPAHGRVARFLTETYIPAARESIAAHALPNGRAWYRSRIRAFTTLDLTPREIHDIGLAEVARIRAEMDAIIDEVGFEGDFAEFLAFLRSDPQFYAREPEDLLARAAWIAKRVDGVLPRYFGRMPRAPYTIEPVPEAIASFYTAGRYVPAAPGGERAAAYWVNTARLDSRPLYTLPALTLHEAVPGHHFQIALANELEEQPPFRRYSYISAYGEGWALYAEYLGREMGIYRTPYERFGQLTYAMWRACRLVVDTGIHALGWSRERALEYLRANTALSAHETGTEIDRYIGWPGQALAYSLGEIRIRALRARAERELGPAFDLRGFHDAILAQGSVPLPLLDEAVEAWINAQRAAATGR
jgi:uncharacterized protein (DUF885 family)